ncbi:MAG: molybdopterin dinucleotide binding domain-containing protein [Phycisphaerae bacterium]
MPGFEPLADIDRTRREFHIGGRVLHAPEFRTPTGRARFFVTPVPPAPPGGPALRLMTIRSEGQFNTVVYEEEDLYRGQERRDVILMNPADLAARRLRPDQPVAVRGPAGELRPVRVRPFDIRPGNAAMYFPEANVLVPGSADPESRTPAFKNVPIEVIPL